MSHWKTVKQSLRYLFGSIDHGLMFYKCSDLRLLAFCDSNWGSDDDDRKSTLGFCVYLGTNLISWPNKKQQVVNRSSAEAKLRSIAVTLAKLSWLKSLLSFFGYMKKRTKEDKKN